VKNHRTSFRPSSTTYVNRAIWASELDSKPFLTTSFFPPLLVLARLQVVGAGPASGLIFPGKMPTLAITWAQLPHCYYRETYFT
jgi:hypothetical protein